MDKKALKKLLKELWHFIWEDNSVLSWVVNIILAFVIIKFLVYPGLGLALGTSYPVVAVVSGSMEHDNGFNSFDEWWKENSEWYSGIGVEKAMFEEFQFKNGFNKGDIMILGRADFEKLKIGDVIVFHSSLRKDPIIHRVIRIDKKDGSYYITTKGDHNKESYAFESDVPQSMVIGKAMFRMPYLGYIKIWFVELLKLVHIV